LLKGGVGAHNRAREIAMMKLRCMTSRLVSTLGLTLPAGGSGARSSSSTGTIGSGGAATIAVTSQVE
jgi:hypothetical protein